MKKVLDKLDEIIDQIPAHIVVIIQKVAIAFGVLLVVIAIIFGISKGMKAAKPGGLQLAKDTKDLFYIDRLKEENAKKTKLIEDIESRDFISSIKMKKQTKYKSLEKDTMNHLMGEKEELLEFSDDWNLRKKNPGYLSDDVPIRSKYNKYKKKEENIIQDKQDILDLEVNRKEEKKKSNEMIINSSSRKKKNTLEFME